MPKEKYRVLLLIFLAGMVCVQLAIAWNSIDLIRKGYPDFTTFYSGASILRQGLGKQLYDEQTQYRVQQQFAAGVSIRQGPLPYIHPSFEALLFIPFTWASYPVAYVLWDALNLLFLVMLLLILRPALPRLGLVSIPVWMLASLAFFPVFFALLQGQDILLLVLLFAGVYVLLRRNTDIAAGCCLGLGLFRFHLVLPLVLILAWQKRTKAILGFLGAAIGLGLISVAIIGWQGAMDYPSHVWHLEQAMERHQTIVPIRMANIRGLLDSLLIPHTSKLVSDVVISVVSLGLILFAARKCKWKTANRVEFDLSFALTIVVTVLVGYHTLAYDLSLLVLPITLTVHHLFENANMDGRARLLFLIPLFLLFFSPLHAFLAMRNGHYNLFAFVLFFWCWVLSKEISRSSPRSLNEHLVS